MDAAVVQVLLKRRPFVPFTLRLPVDMASEISELKIDRPDTAKLFGDETLEVFDSKRQETLLIDLRLVLQIKVTGRLER